MLQHVKRQQTEAAPAAAAADRKGLKRRVKKVQSWHVKWKCAMSSGSHWAAQWAWQYGR